MKKKTLALLCALSLLPGMGGCQGPQLGAPPPSDNTEPAVQTDVQTPAPAQNQKENADPEPNGAIVSPPGEPTIFPLLYLNIDETVTPDTKEIRITAVCGTDEPVEAGISAILEKYESGEWRTIPQKSGTVTADGVVTITPGSSHVFSIFPENYTEPLELLGEYRISVVLGDSAETIGFTVIEETPPLAGSDIEMTIKEGDIVPLGTKSLNLCYRYVGDAIYAEYCFGCEYTLEKKGEDGSWRTVPFSENAAFNELGYLIGTESPNQSTDVSLSDNFYAEPLTAGQYRVIKPIDGNVKLTAGFELAEICRLPLAEQIAEESGSMTLLIGEIHADGFDCTLPWPYPAHYFVECDPAEYPDLCVGDYIEVEYAPMYQHGEWNYYLIPAAIEPSDYEMEPGNDAKPVIYLYPEQETEVEVRLDYRGRLTVTYPEYRDGWRVTAKPDGTLTDADGNEYSYLFWEGESGAEYDFSEGFCVRGHDTAEFLCEKLSLLGLTPREYNEFIVYWLPKMKGNPYNVISFQREAYTERAALTVSPAPDTVLRVFMAYYPSETPVTIPAQTLTPTKRNGFTLVEWGGAESAAASGF